MLINFCVLHLRCPGPRCWLGATASSERATSSLSGAGGNVLHTSNWTKCLSNSEPSYTHQIIIQTRCQQRYFTSFFSSRSPCASLCGLSDSPGVFFSALQLFQLPAASWPGGHNIGLVFQIDYKKVHLLFSTLELLLCLHLTIIFK